MKRLSINDIAKASLRTGKRAYLSLAIGIFLSIFLVTTVFMSAWSVYLDIQEEEARRFGRQDFLLKEGDVSDERLMSEGHFEALGHVYVNAFVGETDRTVGWYDEAAAEIIYRQVIEGRMPEKAGEIALERSVLEEMRKGGEVGDVIHLPLTPVDGVQEERTFTLVGILDERTSEWNLFYSDGDIPFPSALISPEEPGFLSGRKVIHRVMTLASGWEGDVLRYWTTQDNGEHGNLFGCLYTINTWGGFERRWENMQQEINSTPFLLALISMATLMIAFIGIALLIEGSQDLISRYIYKKTSNAYYVEFEKD